VPTSQPKRPPPSAILLAFSADNQYVGPGTYKVELVSDRFLSLRNTKTNKIQALMARPESGQTIETRGRLVFHLEGPQKYLAQVWIAGTSMHSEMAVQHKQEKRACKSNRAPSTIEFGFEVRISYAPAGALFPWGVGATASFMAA
jgi:hypothetical protein